MTDNVYDDLSALRDLLCIVLWSEPYRSYFTNAGGLPADWLNNGAVTPLSLSRAQERAGVGSAWSKAEIAKADRSDAPLP